MVGTGAVLIEDLHEQKGGNKNVWGMGGTAGTSTVGSKRKKEKHRKVD